MKITSNSLKSILKEEMKRVLNEDDLAPGLGSRGATFAQTTPAQAPAPPMMSKPATKPVRNDARAVANAKNIQYSRNGATISWEDNAWRYEVYFDTSAVHAGRLGQPMKPIQNEGATKQAWEAIWSVAGMLKARHPVPQQGTNYDATQVASNMGNKMAVGKVASKFSKGIASAQQNQASVARTVAAATGSPLYGQK